MNLAPDEARARLVAHDHGILCTVHPERGADAVPVVYVVDDDHVGVPVDRVKPKSSLRLQRERNLEADPRATLLVEQWDPDDWSRLWWVRAELRWYGDAEAARSATLAAGLAGRYAQYRDQPFVRVLTLRIVSVTGWAGTGRLGRSCAVRVSATSVWDRLYEHRCVSTTGGRGAVVERGAWCASPDDVPALVSVGAESASTTAPRSQGLNPTRAESWN